MRIALIGFENTLMDAKWIGWAKHWLEVNDTALFMFWSAAEFISINLKDGKNRDFLRNDKQFDLVFVMGVYNDVSSSTDSTDSTQLDTGSLITSPLHTPQKWVQQLLRTNAKKIFIFTRYMSVSAEWLGPLEGYQYRTIEGKLSEMSVYVRVTG